MADQKVTELTEDTSPTTDDLLLAVDDPGGTPTSKKITIANLIALTSPAWTSWTPTMNNYDSGDASYTAKYVQIGKTVHFRLHIDITGTTPFPGIFSFTGPVTANSDYSSQRFHPMGQMILHDTGSRYFPGMLFMDATTTTIQPFRYESSGTYARSDNGQISDSVFSFASGDDLSMSGTYEAA